MVDIHLTRFVCTILLECVPDQNKDADFLQIAMIVNTEVEMTFEKKGLWDRSSVIDISFIIISIIIFFYHDISNRINCFIENDACLTGYLTHV